MRDPIDQAELDKILEDHKKYLGGESVKFKAYFRNVDLIGVDLRGANLRCADLSGADIRDADLRDADLRDADLRDADFCDADLRGANLSGADFRKAKGFILLPVQDSRGYSFCHAVDTEQGWRIRAGCRDFSIEEARDHWGDKYSGDRLQGDMYLYAIDWLENYLEENLSD